MLLEICMYVMVFEGIGTCKVMWVCVCVCFLYEYVCACKCVCVCGLV